jgi:hypothetical protein
VELDTIVRFTSALAADLLFGIDNAVHDGQQVQLSQTQVVYAGGVPEMVAAVHAAERLIQACHPRSHRRPVGTR